MDTRRAPAGPTTFAPDGAPEQALRRERLFAPLLSRLGHDLRSPLNAASLHLVLLRRIAEEDGSKEKLLEWIGQLADELGRLEAMVEAFCATSPAPSDEEEEAVDLWCALSQVAPAANALACHLGLAFEIRGGDSPPLCLVARPKHLRRDLLELTAHLLTEGAAEESEASSFTLSLLRRGDCAQLTYAGLSLQGFPEPSLRLGEELHRLGGLVSLVPSTSVGGRASVTLQIPLSGKEGGS